MDKEMHRKGDGKRVASDNGRDGEAGNEASGRRTVTVPSEMAQNLRVAEDGDITRYDVSARNLVAEKPVLAYILKSALDEYAGYTPQEIAERFIEGKPKVRTIAVHQDHPDRPRDAERDVELGVAAAGEALEAEHGLAAVGRAQDDTALGKAESGSRGGGDVSSGMMSGDDKVIGMPTVDKSQRDGTIFYDIYFFHVCRHFCAIPQKCFARIAQICYSTRAHRKHGFIISDGQFDFHGAFFNQLPRLN